MYIKSIPGFMLSDTGKKVSYVTAGALSTGTLFACFLPQTIFLNQYQKFVQLYKNGFPVPLSETLQSRFQKVLDLLEIDSLDKHLYKSCYIFGFDVMSYGSSYSKYGAIIGLPINFSYTNVNTIDTSRIKLQQESIIWDSDPGQALLKSLVLSENAQLYVMAREVMYRQTLKPVIDIALTVNLVFSTYALSRYFNQKFNFYTKPLGLRLALYSLVGLFNVGLYFMLKDTSQLYFESRIDRELVQKHETFREGGKEFYTKLIERNKALRQLLGSEGEIRYSVLGNENSIFRCRHLPIVQRLSTFESEVSS